MRIPSIVTRYVPSKLDIFVLFWVLLIFSGEKVDNATTRGGEDSSEEDEKEVDEPRISVVKNQLFGILRQVGDGDLRADLHVVEIAAAVVVGYSVGDALSVGELEYRGVGLAAAASMEYFRITRQTVASVRSPAART